MLPMKSYIIRVLWDGEAGVWVAESTDIPGLVSEADSFHELVRKVTAVAPELIELNADDDDGDCGTLVFNQLHVEQIRIHA